MSYEGVKYLETQKLLDAANTVKDSIAEYKAIIQKIDKKTRDLLLDWYGEGKTEFEKDYSTIYKQLTDISEVMYDLYDALVDSDASYIQTDEEIAKGFTMEG
jgi:WXG100 family type VII secretion target